MFYAVLVEVSELILRNRPRAPRHCIVRFGNEDLPGILLQWRPKRQRGGVSAWEGLVVYASQELPSGDWRITQGWMDGDLLRPAERQRSG